MRFLRWLYRLTPWYTNDVLVERLATCVERLAKCNNFALKSQAERFRLREAVEERTNDVQHQAAQIKRMKKRRREEERALASTDFETVHELAASRQAFCAEAVALQRKVDDMQHVLRRKGIYVEGLTDQDPARDFIDEDDDVTTIDERNRLRRELEAMTKARDLSVENARRQADMIGVYKDRIEKMAERNRLLEGMQSLAGAHALESRPDHVEPMSRECEERIRLLGLDFTVRKYDPNRKD